MHGGADCELDFGTPFQLLVAVILSAQCTDKRVNMITDKLFKIASTPEDFAAMPVEELERHIFSCGFYHNKAKAIKEASASIIEMGGMPTTREELMKLRGVGRKTANVVYAVAYGGNAIAVDTHVFRVSNRLGIVSAKTPEETERQLMAAFDEDKWSHLHHLLIFTGVTSVTPRSRIARSASSRKCASIIKISKSIIHFAENENTFPVFRVRFVRRA